MTRGLLVILPLIGINAPAAEYAQAGTLAKNGNWEISVVYDANVNRLTALSQDNYILPQETMVEALREQPLDRGVILTVSGFETNATYGITITNVQANGGTQLPALTLSTSASPMSWAAIGSQELGFPADALAVGETGFDLISGGVEMFGTYDESTFVYQPITGDFDKRVRVLLQEPSSQEARAGLMVREALDEGKARPLNPSDPAQAFSRYLQVQVNPVETNFRDFDGNLVPGANQYQINFRPLPGGNTENPPAGTNAPAYPNAWLRLKRVGQTFHVFRGSDGTNWVRLGTFSFPTTDLDGNQVAPFSATAYVGPNYSPEAGNIPTITGEQRAFLAQFRDYSDASGEVDIEPPQLSIQRAANQIEITWSTGTLQTTTNVATGTWSDLSTASPLKLTPEKHYQFFRARNP